MTISSYFENLTDDAKSDVEALAVHFDDDVWPYVKEFLALLLTQTGKVALSAAIASAPLLATGGFAAAGIQVGTAVAASLATNVPADVNATLATAQAALQVVKASTTTTTANDATQVAAIQAAVPNQ